MTALRHLRDLSRLAGVTFARRRVPPQADILNDREGSKAVFGSMSESLRPRLARRTCRRIKMVQRQNGWRFLVAVEDAVCRDEIVVAA
jgi:hypothetical protein